MGFLVDLYVRTFSKPPFSKYNHVVLKAALRARGYNNFRNDTYTGERFFLEKILAPSKPRVCIDIGANVGDYTRALLEKTTATVVSFEPLPTAFEKLAEQVKDFGGRAVLENKGVGERDEKLTIHYNPDASTQASFSEDIKRVPYVNNDMSAEVDVVSLDSYLAAASFETIDFIKIDTEGFEVEVLKGGADTIGRYKPKYVQIEFNWHQMFRGTTLNDISDLLPGYDVYQLLPGGWVKRDPKDPMTNIYSFANFVFVRR